MGSGVQTVAVFGSFALPLPPFPHIIPFFTLRKMSKLAQLLWCRSCWPRLFDLQLAQILEEHVGENTAYELYDNSKAQENNVICAVGELLW